MKKSNTIKMEINRKGSIDALLYEEKLTTMEDVSGSPVRNRALDGDGLGTRWKTQEDNRQYC